VFTVVAQEDLDALLAQAAASAPELAQEALSQEGEAVTVTNVSVASRDDVFDHGVDEEAESVSLKTTMELEASTYDEAAAMAELMPLVEQQLSALAPAGSAIDASDIVLSEPIVVEANERGTRVEVDATATAWQAFGDAEKASLAAALAGTTDAEATGVLSKTPGIADFHVSYAPTWLPREMPNNPGRITIEVEHP
jgi:hypothetical protein